MTSTTTNNPNARLAASLDVAPASVVLVTVRAVDVLGCSVVMVVECCSALTVVDCVGCVVDWVVATVVDWVVATVLVEWVVATVLVRVVSCANPGVPDVCVEMEGTVEVNGDDVITVKLKGGPSTKLVLLVNAFTRMLYRVPEARSVILRVKSCPRV